MYRLYRSYILSNFHLGFQKQPKPMANHLPNRLALRHFGRVFPVAKGGKLVGETTFQSFPTKLNRVSNILKKRFLRFAKANPQQYIPEFFRAGIQKPARKAKQNHLNQTSNDFVSSMWIFVEARVQARMQYRLRLRTEEGVLHIWTHQACEAAAWQQGLGMERIWSYHANPGSFIFRRL